MHAVPYLTVPSATSCRAGGPGSLAMWLAGHPEGWSPFLDARPEGDEWLLLDRGRWGAARYEAWARSWAPGQTLVLHDHGRASGALAVASGALTERVVSARGRRTAIEITRTLDAGRVRAFGPNYVHELGCPAGTTAVSVHVRVR